MGFEIAVGFSGGKDSQVVYDLCKKSGIKFTAYFSHSFESKTTLSFIREYYPDVVWRRNTKEGFFENIRKNHVGLLPTVECAYCCTDYKHNEKNSDACSIVGVRREESKTRSKRKVFEAKNKTTIKRNSALFSEYFTENCTGSGATSIIQLKPIVDWTENEVYEYLSINKIPLNPEYETFTRVGCVICPKANFDSNVKSLMKYPKLINAVISSRENSKNEKIDWVITSDNKDYTNNKVEYVCRWLNHSFRPFSKKQQSLYKQFLEIYQNL
jgi:phosphoadenosine phosphosulfate reductase